MSPWTLLTLLAMIGFGGWGLRRYRRSARHAYLQSYGFPSRLHKVVLDRYPHLDEAQARQVIAALRQYFRMCQIGGRRNIAMPSQVVDIAWHEFIVFTQLYRRFCRRAFGRFLHHTPAEAMSTPQIAQRGIHNAWRLACRLEGINSKHPDRLPTLFAMDALFDIPDGFHYVINCHNMPRNSGDGPLYCASAIGCGSGCGTGCGTGCSNGDSGCGSSCGSGCGGGD